MGTGDATGTPPRADRLRRHQQPPADQGFPRGRDRARTGDVCRGKALRPGSPARPSAPTSMPAAVAIRPVAAGGTRVLPGPHEVGAGSAGAGSTRRRPPARGVAQPPSQRSQPPGAGGGGRGRGHVHSPAWAPRPGLRPASRPSPAVHPPGARDRLIRLPAARQAAEEGRGMGSANGGPCRRGDAGGGPLGWAVLEAGDEPSAGRCHRWSVDGHRLGPLEEVTPRDARKDIGQVPALSPHLVEVRLQRLEVG